MAEKPDEPDDAVRLRARVDPAECFGFAFCVSSLPDVFRLEAAGTAVALDVDADADLLRVAVEDCPRGAISLFALDPTPDA